jgi:hypothetical protein
MYNIPGSSIKIARRSIFLIVNYPWVSTTNWWVRASWHCVITPVLTRGIYPSVLDVGGAAVLSADNPPGKLALVKAR